MIDGQREDAEHQVTEHLGVAAHSYIARTEIILEAAINALSGAALKSTHFPLDILGKQSVSGVQVSFLLPSQLP